MAGGAVNAVKVSKVTMLLEDRLLIKPDEGVNKTPGGLIIPDTLVEKPRKGTVIATGPGKRREMVVGGPPVFYYEAGNPVSLEEVKNAAQFAIDNNSLRVMPILSPSLRQKVGYEGCMDRHPMTVKVGDRVLYTAHSGQFGGGGGYVEIEGYAEPLLLMYEAEVICVIDV